MSCALGVMEIFWCSRVETKVFFMELVVHGKEALGSRFKVLA